MHRSQFSVYDGSLVIKKFWITTYLPQMSLSEGCLENYIENPLDDRVLTIDKLWVEKGLRLSRLFYDDFTGLALERRLNRDSLCDWSHCEDHSARRNVRA
jgi:hypothetical protein